MSTSTDLQSLEELVISRGWSLVREVMHDEIIQAALAIANTPSMTLDEINFRRGAIWAAHRMIDLPARIQGRLSAEISLNTPATAGKE